MTAILGNGLDVKYSYNGNGTRLKEEVNGHEVFFLTDINRRYEQVLQTSNEDGVVYDTYTYGLQRIKSEGQNDEVYLYDGRGSVAGSVSNNGTVTSYSYTAYGKLMPSSPQPTVFGYNAEATNFDTGMQYLRARYFDTDMSRFFQEDDYRGSFVNPISMNRYAYTHNNPVMGIDPSGYYVTPPPVRLIDGGIIRKKTTMSIEDEIARRQLQIAKRKESLNENKRALSKHYSELIKYDNIISSYNKTFGSNRSKNTLEELRDYHKDRWESAKYAINYNKQRIKVLEEEIKQLKKEQMYNKRVELENQVENYPANDNKNYTVNVCGNNVKDPYAVAKVLLSNVGSTLVKPYLRLLFSNESNATIQYYNEEYLSKDDAVALYYQEQENRNKIVNVMINAIGAAYGGDIISVLITLGDAVFSEIAADAIDFIPTQVLKGIVLAKLDDMSLNMKGSIYDWLKGNLKEEMINAFCNSLDYLHDKYDHVSGGTYVTTDMYIAPPNGHNVPILLISGRFNLTDSGYAYDPNELLNHVIGSRY